MSLNTQLVLECSMTAVRPVTNKKLCFIMELRKEVSLTLIKPKFSVLKKSLTKAHHNKQFLMNAEGKCWWTLFLTVKTAPFLYTDQQALERLSPCKATLNKLLKAVCLQDFAQATSAASKTRSMISFWRFLAESIDHHLIQKITKAQKPKLNRRYN